MRRAAILSAVCCLILGVGVRPSGAQCLPAEARNLDGNYIVPGTRGDIVYRRVGGTALSLDAYVQRGGSRRPAVIVIHGGTWETGSRVSFIGQFLEVLSRAGFNWFAVDYRLGGLDRYHDAIADVRAAVEFVRCRAREFQIDPDNIALLGEDAGAQLALMIGSAAPAGVKAIVSVGGFYDLGELAALKSRYAADLLASASPGKGLLTRMPPLLLIHGGNDTEVPPAQADAFCRAVRAVGRACALTVVDGAIHRPENWWPVQWGYKRELVEWLGRTLQFAAPTHEPYETRLAKDIVFSPKKGLALDAFTPTGAGPFPAVIIAHGGGWEAGDKVTYVTPLFEPLARAGFAWFSIDYRLTPAFRNPDQLDDLREAVQFARANASRFHIDPDRMAILGESASGQLVAQLATERPPGVAAVVSFYGVYDFLQMTPLTGPRSLLTRLFGLTQMDERARETLTRLSPQFHVQPGMSPLLLIQGTADRLHAQSVAFAEQLASAGVPFERYDVPGAPHGVENWEGHADWTSYKMKLVDWLKRALYTPARARIAVLNSQRPAYPFPPTSSSC